MQGVVAGFLAHGLLHIHLVWSIIIGIVIFGILLFLQMTKPGFWIIGLLISGLWGFIPGLVAWSVTGKNLIWFYGVWIAGIMVVMFLHLSARKNMDI